MIESYFPLWNKLDVKQKNKILNTLVHHKVKKGSMIHNGNIECTGLILVKTGQLRAYILSEEGREVTLYRLFDYDLCLFSASCIFSSIQFDITIEAEKDTEMWVIPSEVYKSIMQESVIVSNFTNELMASRFSDVMWLVEQIMWKSLDKRIGSFLLEEIAIENSNALKITHEKIANHIGTHREVVTRMLKYFQKESILELSRGTINIINVTKLENICNK